MGCGGGLMFGKKNKSEHGITLVAENAEIVGDVRFSGELYVHGRIHGSVLGRDETSKLNLAQSGVIEGEVRVAHVVIDGRIEGDVFAQKKVELAEKAVVQGNLYYSLIEMQFGARVDGQLVHTDEASESQSNVRALPERKSIDG